ncbi:UNVERIFIED_CONTAM: hypothetical protein HDU68_000809 [Siphonaria sp. JEL0065]|nr:hypothetical protein HDU68_000809 [Siphonaria sp. JEL0065]
MQRITKKTIETTVSQNGDVTEKLIRTVTRVTYKKLESTPETDAAAVPFEASAKDDENEDVANQQENEPKAALFIGSPSQCAPLNEFVPGMLRSSQDPKFAKIILSDTSRKYINLLTTISFPHIRAMVLWEVTELTDADMERFLETMPNLYTLRIRGCPNITAANPKVIELKENAEKEGPEIRVTIAVPPPVSCDPIDKFIPEMHRIATVPQSVNLVLNGCSREYLDVVVKIQFPHMTSVSVYDVTHFTNEDLQALVVNLPNLETVRLEGNPLFSDLSVLLPLKQQLKQLSLTDSDGLIDFSALQEFTHLVRVWLNRTKIVDISVLQNHADLRQLAVYGANSIDLEGDVGFNHVIQFDTPPPDEEDSRDRYHYLTILGRLPQVCKLTDINGYSFVAFRSVENPRDFCTLRCGSDFAAYADTLTASPEQFRSNDEVGEEAASGENVTNQEEDGGEQSGALSDKNTPVEQEADIAPADSETAEQPTIADLEVSQEVDGENAEGREGEGELGKLNHS